jgi:hypothetical protein
MNKEFVLLAGEIIDWKLLSVIVKKDFMMTSSQEIAQVKN